MRPRWDDSSFGGWTGLVWSGQELAGSVRNSVSAGCDCQRPELATWPGAMASSQLAIQPALKQASKVARRFALKLTAVRGCDAEPGRSGTIAWKEGCPGRWETTQ